MKRMIGNKLEECHESYKTLESILNRRRKKYKPEELESKQEVLTRIKENFDVLKGVFLD